MNLAPGLYGLVRGTTTGYDLYLDARAIGVNMLRVLIIGATSAVAKALACRFADQGAQIFCLARSPEKMQATAALLNGACQGSHCFDFNCNDQAEHAIDLAVAQLGAIDLAIFAHGDLLDQAASESEFCVARRTFETNLLSVIALLLPLCDHMIRNRSGKIAAITSVAGDRGRPRNYTYGSAKGALALYLQGLRSRLWRSGVEIYTIKLGPVISPMTANHEKNWSFSTVDRVADQIVRALKRRRYQVYVPGYWAWIMLAVRSMPEALFQKLRFLSAR